MTADLPVLELVRHTPLVNKPQKYSCEACIILPVRNEEESIGASLAALANQHGIDGQVLDHSRYEILVFLNNCTDGSAERVRSVALRYPTLQLHVIERHLTPADANVGYVRRRLMEEACRRLMQADKLSGAILSTDADTRVSKDWVAWNLQEIAWGANAVGGRIYLQWEQGEQNIQKLRRDYLFEVGYGLLVSKLEDMLDPCRYDPWPRHHQHFGASFALTAEAYRKVGGVPPVEFLEDVELFRALMRSDARVRHSPHVRVNTSARLNGRAAVGLASHLRRLSEEHSATSSPALVESVENLEAKFLLRRKVRSLWRTRRDPGGPCERAVLAVAAETGFSGDQVRREVMKAPTFGRVVEKLALDRVLAERLAPIDQAVNDLRKRLQEPHYKYNL